MTRSSAVAGGRHKAPFIVVGIALACLLLIRNFPSSSWAPNLSQNYLGLHILLEFGVILVSFGIANVGLATFNGTRDLHLLILSVASIAIGAFDLGHTLTFGGMPPTLGAPSADKTLSFWLMSRGVGACVYAVIATTAVRKLTGSARTMRWSLIAVTFLLISIVYDIICFRPELLPTLFVAGAGLTKTKVLTEWVFVLLSSASSVLLFRKAERSENMNTRWIACGCALYAMCGYFFTIYHDLDDLYVFAGHCYKLLSSIVLYRAVFSECVSRPYREAEQANLTKSRFLANVSHELRTPLGIISGFSELVAGSEKLDPELRQWTGLIEKNAKQLSFLINDLLDLTKAEQDRLDLLISRFDVSQTIRGIIDSFELAAREKNVQFEFENLIGDELTIGSDEMRLKQIIVNLIGNAMKFTRNGRIVVTLAKKAGRVRVVVRDTGIGISEKDAKFLFKPFTQLGNLSARTLGGTGLGLVVSKNLAELLGGSLTLLHSVPESGSEFELVIGDLELPPQLNGPEHPRPVSDEFSFVGVKILIAEDSPDNRALLETYLKKTKAEIEFAVNGREAVRKSLEQAYHLILMDLQMPEMDGFDATMAIRRSAWRGPIIALTAHALGPERDRAIANGFNDYLLKPITRTDLCASIKTWLKHADSAI